MLRTQQVQQIQNTSSTSVVTSGMLDGRRCKLTVSRLSWVSFDLEQLLLFDSITIIWIWSVGIIGSVVSGSALKRSATSGSISRLNSQRNGTVHGWITCLGCYTHIMSSSMVGRKYEKMQNAICAGKEISLYSSYSNKVWKIKFNFRKYSGGPTCKSVNTAR